MNTWSFRAQVAALSLLSLGGCAEVPGTAFFTDLAGGLQRDVALSQASMAAGTVTLRAPPGFCIDKRSLSQQFALMARCDTLGVPSAVGDAPLGLITASFIPAGASLGPPSPEALEAALDLSDVRDTQETPSGVTFRATGRVHPVGTGTDHWRGAARVGNQIMGLAFYGPADGPEPDDAGRAALNDIITSARPGG